MYPNGCIKLHTNKLCDVFLFRCKTFWHMYDFAIKLISPFKLGHVVKNGEIQYLFE